jgi:polar amino acid transport system permease protein
MNEWTIIWNARDAFLKGFLKSIELFAYSAILGLLLGCVLLYLLEGRDSLARRGIKALINAMRTLPFLILAYLLYYGLPKFGLRMSADTAGLLALTVYHGAYFCEIFRSQRLVMPVGYIEAALAHGFRHHVIFLRILLPNVVMNTLPLMGNQLIICLKDTAFLSIITVREVTAAANSVQSTYFIPLKAFLVAILLYWLISLVIESTIKQISRLGKKRGFNHA